MSFVNRLVFAALALIIVTAPFAHADKCLSAKLRAVSRIEQRRLVCHAKVAAKGDSSRLATCESNVRARFSAAFAKAGTCVGDQTRCADMADACVAAMTTLLTEPFPSACEAAKRKAAGKLAGKELSCYSMAARKGESLDPTCITKARDRFAAALTKAGTCPDGGSPQTEVETNCVKPVAGSGQVGPVSYVCPSRFDLVETTIPAIQQAIENHLVSAEDLVRMYLGRIAAYDGPDTATHLNSYIHLSERALSDAHAVDQGGAAGYPLFGIPVVLKDNIDTGDMPTTAGSVALAGSVPQSDAFVTRKLREAGAIILGKATMTEFANFLTTRGMPPGYSSLGGYSYNPYDPRPDPRTGTDAFGQPLNDGRPALTPSGSSSGPAIAVAANLSAVGIGDEAEGSILGPGSANGLVGIKPTIGLISRDGIIPISVDQDTPGPLARTVADAAIVLGVITGFDPNDPATEACLTPGNCFSDYTQFLDADALIGARIAVPPFPANRATVMNDAMAVLTAQGATVMTVPALALLLLDCPSDPPEDNYPPAAGCTTALHYGFKRDLNQYIAAHLRPEFPIKSLADIVAFNIAFGPAATKYGQDLAIFSQMFDTSDGSTDTLRYQSDREDDISRSRTAILGVLNGPDGLEGTADDFDALLLSGLNGSRRAGKAGYPSVVVPGGTFQNIVTPEFPPGFDAQDGPTGVTLSGRAFSEPRLIGLAYAFEQATHHRTPPASTPPLATDVVIKP